MRRRQQDRDRRHQRSAPATTRCRCRARSTSPSRSSPATRRRFRSSCRRRRARSTSATSSFARGSSCAATSASTSCSSTTCRGSSAAYRSACAPTGVDIDRSNFIRNPTSCAAAPARRDVHLTRGRRRRLRRRRIRPPNCAALPFSPKLRFEVSGETKKDGHPTLEGNRHAALGSGEHRQVARRPAGRDPARHGGALPPGRASARRRRLATRTCPANSKVGTAKATTPLLPDPLSGPVYIVQHSGNPLPKLAIFLDGRVSIKLEAQNELAGLKIVNRFDSIPDLPVSSFELTINGGKNGVLKNYGDLCDRVQGEVTFTAHSGKTVERQAAGRGARNAASSRERRACPPACAESPRARRR